MLILLRKEEYPRDNDELIKWSADPDFEKFLDVLADALKHHTHAVVAPPKLLGWMARCDRISGPQRTALDEAIDYNQRGELPWDEASHALLLTGPRGPGAHPAGGRTLWIRRDWRWLASRAEGFSKAVLVAENSHDAELFIWVGRALSARVREAGTNAGDEVALSTGGGGGSTTETVYAQQIRQGSPTLCVVDTDKTHPSGQYGDTATAVCEIHRELRASPDNPPHAVEVLEAYTVENVVPTELVKQACAGDNWVEPMTRRGFFLQQVSASSGSVPRAHVEPALKYVKPAEASAKRLRDSAGIDAALCLYREAAIRFIRERDPDALAEDDKVFVLGVGKLPQRLVAKLEEFRDHRKRPGKFPSAAHWLCSQLLSSPDTFVEEWEHIARAVWSWGLRFPPKIRAR
jgi:hypothetical protein